MNPTAVSLPDEETVILNGIPGPEIRSQLERILRSRAFIQSHRIRRFLQFIVEESLLGQPHRLKEYLIGLEVFDRRDAFDPRVDSIVRVEARRLRHKLEEYYRSEGREDLIRITLRKGSYVPIFEPRTCRAQPGHPGTAARYCHRSAKSHQRTFRRRTSRRRDSPSSGTRLDSGRLFSSHLQIF